jgi:hypothetical protein
MIGKDLVEHVAVVQALQYLPSNKYEGVSDTYRKLGLPASF